MRRIVGSRHAAVQPRCAASRNRCVAERSGTHRSKGAHRGLAARGAQRVLVDKDEQAAVNHMRPFAALCLYQRLSGCRLPVAVGLDLAQDSAAPGCMPLRQRTNVATPGNLLARRSSSPAWLLQAGCDEVRRQSLMLDKSAVGSLEHISRSTRRGARFMRANAMPLDRAFRVATRVLMTWRAVGGPT